MAPRRAAVLRIAALFCLLAASLALASCGGDASTRPTGSQTPSATATATSSPTFESPTPSASPAAPPRDLLDLARRFRGASQDASRPPLRTYRAGDSDTFYVIDLETPRTFAISATAALVTDHAYFFVQDGITYSPTAMERVGRDFEDIVYPAVTAAFGGIPGPERGQRITILHARLKGAAGYFNQGDEFPRSIVPLSNDGEILYIDAGMLESPGTS